MDVVLKKDYPSLGKAMDIIKVRDGYARNFLIPQGIAVLATEGNAKSVAEARRVAEKREGKRLEIARELAKKIENVPCTIAVEVGEDDKMFGSVTAAEISEFLKKEGHDIPKAAIKLGEPIRSVGVYNIDINLFKDISASLKVWVVKKEDAQA